MNDKSKNAFLNSKDEKQNASAGGNFTNKPDETKSGGVLNDSRLEGYFDDGPVKTPEINSISDSLYGKLFDITYGYLISSAAGLFFLTFLLPMFYVTYAGLSAGAKTFPGIYEVVSALGAGWAIIFSITSGFFIGGAALFNSMRAGRAILKYLFTLLALIMLFEFRYFINRSSWQSISEASYLAFFIAVLSFAAIAMAFKTYRDKSIALMIFFNILLVSFNAGMLLHFFAWFNGDMVERHIHYLSLFIMAAIILQTIGAAGTFLPFVKGIFVTRFKQGFKNSKNIILLVFLTIITISSVLVYDNSFYMSYYFLNLFFDIRLASTAEDIKIKRTKADCKMLADAIKRYNKLEKDKVTSVDMNELSWKYVPGVLEMTDPWGSHYEHDSVSCMVYSKGPDQKHIYGGLKSDYENKDDRYVIYADDKK